MPAWNRLQPTVPLWQHSEVIFHRIERIYVSFSVIASALLVVFRKRLFMVWSESTGFSNRFIGNYALGELIGEGGFGKVYKAQHRYLDKPACAKVVHSSHLDEVQIEFLWREAKVLNLLD